MFNRTPNNLHNNSEYSGWRVRSGIMITIVAEEASEASSSSGHGTRVTLNLPAGAADKLSQLLAAGDHVLRELGIASLQLDDGEVNTEIFSCKYLHLLCFSWFLWLCLVRRVKHSSQPNIETHQNQRNPNTISPSLIRRGAECRA